MICVGGDLDNMAVARTGFNAADYEVLVRNAAGKSLARLRPAKRIAGRSAAPSTRRMRVGDGIRAILPLVQWFDMKKPGRYSVLVSLPSAHANDPPWVAEPLTVTVPK